MGYFSIYRLFLILLVCSCQIQGSRAQTPVFVKTGEDLHLEVKKTDVPEGFITIQWKFNGSVSFVSFLRDGGTEVSDRYRRRVNVSVENFSVKLKNLQKSDSGVYTALVISTGQSPTLPGYLVTVVDPVSPVKLTVDSVTNSSDSCDLTVTCRSLDSHQISISTTVTCNTTTCSQEGGERSNKTTSGATLHVYLMNDTIICNHNNQVSRTNDSINVGPSLCLTDPESLRDHTTTVVVVVGGVGGVVVVLALGLISDKKKRKGYRLKEENTVYAETGPRRPVDQSQTNDASAPSTTYDLVGTHNGPIKSPETRANSLPENPYAEAEAAQSLERSPTLSPTSEPSQSIYSMVGPHTGPTASPETGGKLPESLYSLVNKYSEV